MSIESVTASGRFAAEARMLDACTITRAGASDTTFNSTTGVYTDAADSEVYDGACEVQVSDGLNAQTTEAGGQVVVDQRVTVKVPVSASGVRRNDVVTITAVHDGGDLELVGKSYRVIAAFAKSFPTSRRLQVEEVTL